MAGTLVYNEVNVMQRVTNCILISHEHILMIKKPRRGWYAIPGGKMEQGESIKEAVEREFQEETALKLNQPDLAGVFTFNIYNNANQLKEEWMMFTFKCDSYDGKLTDFCNEGELEWVPIEKIKTLPMAEGDRRIFEHMLNSNEMLYGTFEYTIDYELIDFRFDPILGR